MASLPVHIQKYLWDIKPQPQSLTKNKEFIIERVLEYGDQKALTWLNKNISLSAITKTLKTSRRISPKTGHFFALYYQVPKKEVRCIRLPFTQKQDRFC